MNNKNNNNNNNNNNNDKSSICEFFDENIIKIREDNAARY